MDELQGTPAGFREALQAIDEVNLDVVFRRRANVIKSVPHILKGPYRIEEIVAGHDRGDILRQERGWKAFMLLEIVVSSEMQRRQYWEKLREWFDGFRAGRWASLLAESVENDEEADLQPENVEPNTTGKWKTSNLVGVGSGSTRQLHGWNVIVKMTSCPHWMSLPACILLRVGHSFEPCHSHRLLFRRLRLPLPPVSRTCRCMSCHQCLCA